MNYYEDYIAAKERFKYHKESYDELIDAILDKVKPNMDYRWNKDWKVSKLDDAKKAEMIAWLYIGNTDRITVNVPHIWKNGSREERLDYTKFFVNYPMHKYANSYIIPPTYIMPMKEFKFRDLGKDKIKDRWIDRLKDCFDKKIETCLDGYNKYLNTLKGKELLNEMNMEYTHMNVKKLGISNWVVIPPQKNNK